jgi:Na+-transporting NADH:ubiquinone oxidoreductase subunit NqrB
MNIFEKLFCFPSFSIIRFLIAITLLQFWWIAIWGLAYMAIEAVAGKSKNTEFWIYIALLLCTVLIIRLDPSLVDRL